ncbi:MAG: hypothetical protein Q9M45_02175 [Robiginitomaculum sp.]|nr:hypothetical protein [Robiginitomaculum sp.]
MSRAEFRKRAQNVVDQFTALNPYKKPGSILQIEDVNYADGTSDQLKPLYVFAISAKALCAF